MEGSEGVLQVTLTLHVQVSSSHRLECAEFNLIPTYNYNPFNTPNSQLCLLPPIQPSRPNQHINKTHPMAPPTPLPKYVYKITPSPPPTPLPESYPASDLDARDGFIHLSTAAQIPVTAGLFFAGDAAIWVIKVRLGPHLAAATRWEDSLPGCPHLHGRSFGRADVEGVAEFRREGGGDWAEVLGREGKGFLE